MSLPGVDGQLVSRAARQSRQLFLHALEPGVICGGAKMVVSTPGHSFGPGAQDG